MNLPRHIAARMARKTSKTSWSRPVVQIATAGVALGIALIILSTSIVEGFQREVRDLVVGFGAHVQVLATDPGQLNVKLDPALQAALAATDGVERVQPFYTLPGILETRDDHEGVVVKGVGEGLEQGMLRRSLQAGRVPMTGDSVVISGPQARELHLQPGDAVRLYLVAETESPRPRRLVVAGIYETGLLEFDREFVFVPAPVVQRAAGWGVEAQARADSTSFVLEAFPRGAAVSWAFPGLGGVQGPGPHPYPDRDFEAVAVPSDERVAGDTVRFTRTAEGWRATSAGGGSRFHASGYEVFLKDFDGLWQADDLLYQALPLGYTTKTVIEQSPEMFSWLGMLDLNVEIIIGLMVLISIINMASALLIIILERTAMVGLLKALGMADGAVVRIFVTHAARILGRGFLWGNLLGFGLAIGQISSGIITLDPAAYYIDTVPISLNLPRIALIELGAFAVCAAAMTLPAWASTRIQPATALRFR